MWVTCRELIHVGNVIRIGSQGFSRHPTKRDQYQRNRQMTRISQLEQPIEKRAGGDEEERINGKKMPDADVNVAGHREHSIDAYRDQQPQTALVPFSQQSPQCPGERGQRYYEEGQ